MELGLLDAVDEVLREEEALREDVVDLPAEADSAVAVALAVDEVVAADSAGVVDVVRREAVEEGTRRCDTCTMLPLADGVWSSGRMKQQ